MTVLKKAQPKTAIALDLLDFKQTSQTKNIHSIPSSSSDSNKIGKTKDQGKNSIKLNTSDEIDSSDLES